MAAPGTKELIVNDATNKKRVEWHTLTTQPGGVLITAGLGQVDTAFATLNTFVANPVTIQVVIASDKRSVTVYSTDDNPLAVSVLLVGDA